MDTRSFFKKFAAVAANVAPMVLLSLGVPPIAASAITHGIVMAQGMPGATNDEKAAKAAEIAQAGLVTMNALAVQHGGAPIVDEQLSASTLAQAVKITYDVSKLVHTANGDPMPSAALAPA